MRRIVLLFALLWACGCDNGDYATALPNGYRLARTNAYTKAIFAPQGKTDPSHAVGGIAVAAQVDRMAVVGKVVTGHVVASPQSELASVERPGYFVLDTETGRVELGLTEAAWVSSLRAAGITKTPSLSTP